MSSLDTPHSIYLLPQILTDWSAGLHRRVLPTDDFFDLGGDSLLALELTVRISEQVGRPISVEALLDNPTPARWAAAVSAQNTPDATGVRLIRPGEGPPLVVVHAASGTTHRYRGLLSRLTARNPVYGISARSLSLGEGLDGSLRELAREYVGELRAADVAPAAIIGYSMGGLLSFSMAQAMAPDEPDLVLLDPLIAVENRVPEAYWVRYVAERLLRLPGDDHGVPAGIGRDEALADVVRTAQGLGILPQTAEAADGLRRVVELHEVHSRLAAEYTPDGLVPRALLIRAGDFSGPDPWASHVKQLETATAPASHHQLLSAPDSIAAVARYIDARLERPTVRKYRP